MEEDKMVPSENGQDKEELLKRTKAAVAGLLSDIDLVVQAASKYLRLFESTEKRLRDVFEMASSDEACVQVIEEQLHNKKESTRVSEEELGKAFQSPLVLMELETVKRKYVDSTVVAQIKSTEAVEPEASSVPANISQTIISSIVLENPAEMSAPGLISIMEQHMKDLPCVLQCLRAIKANAKERPAFLKALAGDERSPRVLMSCVEAQRFHHRPMSRSVLSLLNLLAHSSSSLKAKLVEEYRAVEFTLEVMRETPEAPVILTNACAFLAALASMEEYKSKIVDLGAVQVLVTAMRSHSVKDLQQFGCTVLWNLSFQNDQNKAKLREYGALNHLVYVLEQSQSNGIALSIAVVGTLESLSVDAENENLLMELRVVSHLRKTMKQFSNNVVVQNRGMGLLFNLAFGKKYQHDRALEIVEQGGFEAAIDVLKTHESEVNLLVSALGCIQFISADKEVVKKMEDIVDVHAIILDLMKRHNNETTFVDQGNATLKALGWAKSKTYEQLSKQKETASISNNSKNEAEDAPDNKVSEELPKNSKTNDEVDSEAPKPVEENKSSSVETVVLDSTERAEPVKKPRKSIQKKIKVNESDLASKEASKPGPKPGNRKRKLEKAIDIEKRRKLKKGTMNCPGGHPLKRTRIDAKGLECDKCSKSLDNSLWSMSCIRCDYDICEACSIAVHETVT